MNDEERKWVMGRMSQVHQLVNMLSYKLDPVDVEGIDYVSTVFQILNGMTDKLKGETGEIETGEMSETLTIEVQRGLTERAKVLLKEFDSHLTLEQLTVHSLLHYVEYWEKRIEEENEDEGNNA